MVGMHTSGVRYRCSCETTFRRGMDYEQRNCHEKTVNGERLEAATWKYVIDILTDPVRFEEEWRKAQQSEAESQAQKRERLEIVETLINQSSEEAARIVREMSEYKETERERPSYSIYEFV
jgi:transposase